MKGIKKPFGECSAEYWGAGIIYLHFKSRRNADAVCNAHYASRFSAS